MGFCSLKLVLLFFVIVWKVEIILGRRYFPHSDFCLFGVLVEARIQGVDFRYQIWRLGEVFGIQVGRLGVDAEALDRDLLVLVVELNLRSSMVSLSCSALSARSAAFLASEEASGEFIT
jgi:hypothetical protein